MIEWDEDEFTLSDSFGESAMPEVEYASDRGSIMDFVHSAYKGLAMTSDLIGGGIDTGIQYFGGDKLDVGGSFGVEGSGNPFTNLAEGMRNTELAKDDRATAMGEDSWAKKIGMGIVENIIPSAAVIGTGVTAGPMAGVAALGGMFYGGTYQHALKEAADQGLTGEPAKKYAHDSALAEVAFEALGDIFTLGAGKAGLAGAKALKAAKGKVGVDAWTAAAKANALTPNKILKESANQIGLPKTLALLLGTSSVEGGTEVATSLYQNYAREKAGLEVVDEDLWDTMAIGMGMGGGISALSTAKQGSVNRVKRRNMEASLQHPDKEVRLKTFDDISEGLSGATKEKWDALRDVAEAEGLNKQALERTLIANNIKRESDKAEKIREVLNDPNRFLEEKGIPTDPRDPNIQIMGINKTTDGMAQAGVAGPMEGPAEVAPGDPKPAMAQWSKKYQNDDMNQFFDDTVGAYVDKQLEVPEGSPSKPIDVERKLAPEVADQIEDKALVERIEQVLYSGPVSMEERLRAAEAGIPLEKKDEILLEKPKDRLVAEGATTEAKVEDTVVEPEVVVPKDKVNVEAPTVVESSKTEAVETVVPKDKVEDTTTEDATEDTTTISPKPKKTKESGSTKTNDKVIYYSDGSVARYNTGKAKGYNVTLPDGEVVNVPNIKSILPTIEDPTKRKAAIEADVKAKAEEKGRVDSEGNIVAGKVAKQTGALLRGKKLNDEQRIIVDENYDKVTKELLGDRAATTVEDLKRQEAASIAIMEAAGMEDVTAENFSSLARKQFKLALKRQGLDTKVVTTVPVNEEGITPDAVIQEASETALTPEEVFDKDIDAPQEEVTVFAKGKKLSISWPNMDFTRLGATIASTKPKGYEIQTFKEKGSDVVRYNLFKDEEYLSDHDNLYEAMDAAQSVENDLQETLDLQKKAEEKAKVKPVSRTVIRRRQSEAEDVYIDTVKEMAGPVGKPTNTDVMGELEQHLTPAALSQAVKEGNIVVASTRQDLPADVLAGTNDNTVAIYDPRSDTIYLIGDRIGKGKTYEVLTHEVTHREIGNLFNDPQSVLAEFIRSTEQGVLESYAKAKANNPVDPSIPGRRTEAEIQSLWNEEALAYYISDNADTKPSLWKRIIAKVKMFLVNNFGFNASRLTPEDLVAIIQDTTDNFRMGKAPDVDGYPKHMVSGAKAETANKAELEYAKEMEANGDSPINIKRATGWYKWVDDKWRFLFTDKDMKVVVDKDILRGTLSIPGMDGTIKLDGVISHDKLFEAYPQLRDLDIKLINDPKEKFVGFSLDNTVTLNFNYIKTVDQMTELLAHEIQHQVQAIEGFARGGSSRNNNMTPTESEAYNNAKYIVAHPKDYTKGRIAAAQELLEYQDATRVERYNALAGEVEARATGEDYLASQEELNEMSIPSSEYRSTAEIRGEAFEYISDLRLAEEKGAVSLAEFAEVSVPKNNERREIEPIKSYDEEVAKSMESEDNSRLGKIKTHGANGYESVSKAVKNIFQSVSDAIYFIDKRIAGKMDVMDANATLNYKRYLTEITPFVNQFKALEEEDRRKLSLALYNNNRKVAEEILDKDTLDRVDGVLEELNSRADKVGLLYGSKQKGYFPRRVNDLTEYLDYMSDNGQNGLFDATFKAKQRTLKGGKSLSEADKTAAIAEMLRSGQISALPRPGATKGRSVPWVYGDTYKFYGDASSALIGHIFEMNEKLGYREFAGGNQRAKHMKEIERKTKQIEKETDTNKLALLQAEYNHLEQILSDEETELTDSVAELIKQSSPDMSAADTLELMDLIKTRLRPKGAHGFVDHMRNVSYITSMGNFMSALTQIGDIPITLYANGLNRDSLSAIGGAFKTIAKLIANDFNRKTGRSHRFDVGQSFVADMDFTNQLREFSKGSVTANMLDTVFKYSGLKYTDLIGKESMMQASFAKINRMDKEEFVERYQPLFGDKVEEAFSNRGDKKANTTQSIVFSELAKWQPISMSQQSKVYLQSGNARIFFMLKTFTMRAVNAAVREGLMEYNNSDKNSFDKAKMASRIGAIVLIYAMAGAGVDEIKDMIRGKENDLSDTVVDNIFGMFLISTYDAQMGLERDQLITKIVHGNMPPLRYLDQIGGDLMSVFNEDKEQKMKTLNLIPLVGNLVYGYSDAGRETEYKYRKESLQDELVHALDTGGSLQSFYDKANEYNQLNIDDQVNIMDMMKRANDKLYKRSIGNE